MQYLRRHAVKKKKIRIKKSNNKTLMQQKLSVFMLCDTHPLTNLNIPEAAKPHNLLVSSLVCYNEVCSQV